jgi:hypothetical protein
MALIALGLNDRNHPMAQLVAKKVFEIRQMGVRDPAKICSLAVSILEVFRSELFLEMRVTRSAFSRGATNRSRAKERNTVTVSQNRYHARQAAAALLKMAKTTSDPRVAAGLVEAAADLKERTGWGATALPMSTASPKEQTEE